MVNFPSAFLSPRARLEVSPAKATALLATIFLALVLTSLALAAQVPKTEAEIPVFPAAVPNKAGEAERMDQEGGPDAATIGAPGLVFKDKSLYVYTVNSTIEEVFNFYLQKLGGKDIASGEPYDVDPSQLEPGNSTQMGYRINLHEFKDIYSEDGTLSKSGKAVRDILQTNRKPHKPGQWIVRANFGWATRDIRGEITFFSVLLDDLSLSYDWKTYAPKTDIVIRRETHNLEGEADQEQEEAPESRKPAAAKSGSGLAPTEAELGAPIYPGSTYDVQNSAGMSQGGDFRYSIFLSNDPPAKVAAFYEQKLKIKPSPSEGGYIIPLKGSLPNPDEGIAIQPNMLGGTSAKTMIVFQKQEK